MQELTLNDQCLAKTLGIGSHPVKATSRYESEPPIILDSLNDSAAAGSELAKAFAIQNERIRQNAYKIYEN